MPDFSKKHYEKIAEALRDARSNCEGLCAYDDETLISTFAALFEKDNPKFNRERFITAVEGE